MDLCANFCRGYERVGGAMIASCCRWLKLKAVFRRPVGLPKSTGSRVRLSTWMAVMALPVLVVGCGGGAKSTEDLLQPPSNLTYPQTSISATVGIAITTITPTVSGTVSSYSITPALPAGLAISSSSGAISGTPTAASAKASYTVTALNSAGSTTALVSITVAVAAPSNLVYPQTAISATVGKAITPDVPTVDGTVESYSIAPALPAGLTIDGSTGAISGTPTAVSAKNTYTVTASNSTGSTTADVTITVASGSTAILELGHTTGILSVRVSSDRALTEDIDGHWNLWDYGTGKILASGDGALTTPGINQRPFADDAHRIDLAGDLAGVETASEVEVFSAATGQELFTVPGATWFKLAVDGSYICTGSTSGLTVWSAAGLQEFTRTGNYYPAKVFAAPGQVQVALGPAGSTVIETDSVPSGDSTVSASFSGAFNTWFNDGRRFLTNLGNTVWVYSSSGVQQSVMNLNSVTGLTGQGDWIWSVGAWDSGSSDYPISVYAVGNATPVATYAAGVLDSIAPSGSFFAILRYEASTMQVIDLSGASPAATDHHLPDAAFQPEAFGAYSSSQWMVGNVTGVVLDGASLSGTARYFGYGSATGIAGSPSSIAVATSAGSILLFDATGAMQQESIKFLSGKLAMSADGAVLAASASGRFSQYVPDRSLNTYSLPSGALLSSIPYDVNSTTPVLTDFSLSASGQTLGQVLEDTSSGSSREVTGIDGSPVIWSDTGTQDPLVLSPDGTNFAAAGEDTLTAAGYVPTATLWTNGTLVTAIQATPEGWVDNTHLLAATYLQKDVLSERKYTGSNVYDPTGKLITTLPSSFPAIPNPHITSDGLVYDPLTNAVYSPSTGAAVWSGPSQKLNPQGAVAGSNIVYVNGHTVYVSTY